MVQIKMHPFPDLICTSQFEVFMIQRMSAHEKVPASPLCQVNNHCSAVQSICLLRIILLHDVNLAHPGQGN